MGRTLLLRALGLLTTFAVGIAATALITFGMDRSVGWLEKAITGFSSWTTRTPEEGAAILAGLGLVIVAILCIPVVVKWTGRRWFRLEETPAGATTIDLASVAYALKTTVTTAVDPQVEVEHRRGRIVVTTPSRPNDTFGVADEASAAVEQKLKSLGLTEIAYSIATGRKEARRAR